MTVPQLMQNPEKSSPPNAGLSDEQKVDYPKVRGNDCSSTNFYIRLAEAFIPLSHAALVASTVVLLPSNCSILLAMMSAHSPCGCIPGAWPPYRCTELCRSS